MWKVNKNLSRLIHIMYFWNFFISWWWQLSSVQSKLIKVIISIVAHVNIRGRSTCIVSTPTKCRNSAAATAKSPSCEMLKSNCSHNNGQFTKNGFPFSVRPNEILWYGSPVCWRTACLANNLPTYIINFRNIVWNSQSKWASSFM